ncbi:hypothetical protein CKO51_06075 [Rhodopirellula sp. SM50]|nr:hypothetical protein CKO51_06075 [Rhodopirellula sp. SM50]
MAAMKTATESSEQLSIDWNRKMSLPAFLRISNQQTLSPRSSDRRRRRGANNRRRLLLESLQKRELMAADVSLDDGILQINGTDSGDAVEISYRAGDTDRSQIQVAVLGQTTQLFDNSAATIQQIVFRGHAGNDRVQNNTNIFSRFYGGDGDDILIGGSAGDLIDGQNGNDTLYGGAGNDSLYGGYGNDRIYAGDGNDRAFGHFGDDYITGQAGDDIIVGGQDDDTLWGYTGNDRIYGNAGDDWISGGGGNDRVYGQDGNDKLYGYTGDDVIYAGAGDDYVSGWQGRDVILGEAGNDRIYGGSESDRIYGQAGNDSIYGGDGDDRIYGHEGQDVLDGQVGNDLVVGGDGNDKLYGWTGNDHVYGGDGDDYLSGWHGNDKLFGGDGDDRIYGGEGDDEISGWTGNDWITGQEGNDQIRGESGDDTLYGYTGDDLIIAGAGNDFVSGWKGNDTILGGPGDDELRGRYGTNRIEPGTGNDRLTSYGNGTTFVFAGAQLGTDTITTGDAHYATGTGDTLDFSAMGEGIRITLPNFDDNDVSVINSDLSLKLGGRLSGVIGTAHNDVIVGSSQPNEIEAGGGNDLIDTRRGNSVDHVVAGDGDDWVVKDVADTLVDEDVKDRVLSGDSGYFSRSAGGENYQGMRLTFSHSTGGTVTVARWSEWQGSRGSWNNAGFESATSRFERLEGRFWIEKRDSGVDSHFVEVDDRQGRVTLFDASRNLFVQLRHDRGLFRSADNDDTIARVSRLNGQITVTPNADFVGELSVIGLTADGLPSLALETNVNALPKYEIVVNSHGTRQLYKNGSPAWVSDVTDFKVGTENVYFRKTDGELYRMAHDFGSESTPYEPYRSSRFGKTLDYDVVADGVMFVTENGLYGQQTRNHDVVELTDTSVRLGDTLYVIGTELDDNIHIYHSGERPQSLLRHLNGWVGDGIKQIQVRSLGGNDRIENHTGVEMVAYGGDGGDRIYGGSGVDVLLGEAGRDYLFGGESSDWLFGGDGDDYLYGQGGADALNGQAGADQLRGGSDVDYVLGIGADRDDTLFFDDGSSLPLGSDVAAPYLTWNSNGFSLNHDDGFMLRAERTASDKEARKQKALKGLMEDKEREESERRIEVEPPKKLGAITDDGSVTHPVDVAGAYLTDFANPFVVARVGSGDDNAYEANDVTQPASLALCTFSATLASAADNGFDLASGIRFLRSGQGVHYYAVRLFKQVDGVYRESWTEVPFRGFIDGFDAQPEDGGELWSLLYHRAYLLNYAQVDSAGNPLLDAKGHLEMGDYRNAAYSIPALTGHTTTDLTRNLNSHPSGLRLARSVYPVMIATTREGWSGADSLGIYAWHSYSVMDVEGAANDPNPTVVLRDPQGGENHNIRISWANFQARFTSLVAMV